MTHYLNKTDFKIKMFTIKLLLKIKIVLLVVFTFFVFDSNAFSKNEVRFQIKNGEKMLSFVKRLKKAQVSSYSIFLKISKTEQLKQFKFVPSIQFIQKINVKYPLKYINRFEGLFVPGKYRIKVPEKLIGFKKSKRKKYLFTVYLIKRLLKKTAIRIKKYGKNPRLGLYKTLILSSIVEKEAAWNKHYYTIAGVFLNRVKRGIRLASCPTVEYFVGFHRPFLLFKELRQKNVYNTYLNVPLPPTPIAFFTDNAYKSVAKPKKTKYLFFVLDWAKEKHYFAVSFKRHEKNIDLSKNNYYKKYGRRSIRTKYINKYYEN